MGTHPIFESDFDCLTENFRISTMIIYKDIFSQDELASDTYKIKIVDEVILEIECKVITVDPSALDESLLGGANASAEDGPSEDALANMISGPNLVFAHRLQATAFDKKGWTVYIKDFMKRTLKHLEANKPERVPIFKANAQGAVKKILGSFKEWEMYIGESMDPEGAIGYLNYREDGITPYVWFFIDSLDAEKV